MNIRRGEENGTSGFGKQGLNWGRGRLRGFLDAVMVYPGRKGRPSFWAEADDIER